MDDDRFTTFFNGLLSRKRFVGALVGGVLLCAGVGLFFVPLGNSLEVMLPAGSKTQESVRFLREIDFSAKVVLSFSQTDDTLDRPTFFAEIDAFSRSLDSPQISKVVNIFDEQQMMNDLGFFLQRAPELFGEKERLELENQLTPTGVKKSLRKKYIQLLKPEGSFMGALIRRDPLDIQMAMVEKIRSLSSSFGYAMRIENNHIVSTDGTHVLLIIETSVPFTDSEGSRELIGFLDRRIATLPPSISADVICGHLHTLSNEKMIKRDIALTVSLAGVAFILLFLFFFKDVRANLIFLLPFAALLVAVNLSALIFGSLSPMMLGLGSVIAGITVDYAIHVYVAVRRGASTPAAVRAVARPVLLGAITTAAVFSAFFASSIPGYHQLACFAMLSVVISVVAALFILPLFLVPDSLHSSFPPLGKWKKKKALGTMVCFALLIIATIPAIKNIRFDGDIARLDGSNKSVVDAEARFQKTWGDGESGQAIAAVSHSDYEQALMLNDQLFKVAIEKMDEAQVASLSRIWKSRYHRKENAARWESFWDEERVGDLKALIHEQGAPFGFATDAFDPFFQSLEHPEALESDPAGNIVFSHLKNRFVQQRNGRTQVLTFFPDRPDYIEAMETVLETIPESALVSRNALSRSLSRDYTHEFVRIGAVALGLVLLASVVLLKDLRLTLIVLLPALAGALGVVVLSYCMGVALNVMNLVSGIIVIGLCIDYGIFYLHSYTHSLNLGTRSAITLSAGTTLIGSAALLFAHHPALYSVGLTLVGGIAAGYATSMLVVPALCSLWLGEEKA